MEIGNIVITGEGESNKRIETLLLKAAAVVSLSDRDFPTADMIVETTSLNAESKAETFRQIGKQAKKDVIIASTSRWGITELASVTKRPWNFVGLNFIFNPFQNDRCFVQIVKGLETLPDAIIACKSLLQKAGAISIQVEDFPCQVVDRVLAATINEATNMHLSGVATIEDIDKVTRSCLNWPKGPFEFADIIGIDVVLVTLEILTREYGPRFLPSRLLKQMVAAGRLGIKTGQGFYTYR